MESPGWSAIARRLADTAGNRLRRRVGTQPAKVQQHEKAAEDRRDNGPGLGVVRGACRFGVATLGPQPVDLRGIYGRHNAGDGAQEDRDDGPDQMVIRLHRLPVRPRWWISAILLRSGWWI